MSVHRPKKLAINISTTEICQEDAFKRCSWPLQWSRDLSTTEITLNLLTPPTCKSFQWSRDLSTTEI